MEPRRLFLRGNQDGRAYAADATRSGGGRRESRAWSVSVRSKSLIRSRSEEHTSELQSLAYLVCRLLLEKKKSLRTSRSRYKSHPASASFSSYCWPSHSPPE